MYGKLEVDGGHVPRALFWIYLLAHVAKRFVYFLFKVMRVGYDATERTFYCKKLQGNDNKDNSYWNSGRGSFVYVVSLQSHASVRINWSDRRARASSTASPTATIYSPSGMETRLFKCLALINCSRFAYKRPGKEIKIQILTLSLLSPFMVHWCLLLL